MSELINMTKEQLDDTVKNMLGGIVDSAVAKALEALNKGKEHQQVEEPPLEKLGEIVRG